RALYVRAPIASAELWSASMRQGPEILTLEELRQIMPRLPEEKAREYLPLLIDAMVEAEITTPARMAAFLAQLGHESLDLRYMEEIADGSAYEGRRDLGNTQPGDGKRYKGRGPIQLTGRANYRAAGKALGIPLEEQPELAAMPEHDFRIAAWYWNTWMLNHLADQRNFLAITVAINEGLNEYADRSRRADTAKTLLRT